MLSSKSTFSQRDQNKIKFLTSISTSLTLAFLFSPQMSSDLFLLDASYLLHASSDILSLDLDMQFLSNDAFSSFEDQQSNFLQEAISNNPDKQFLTHPAAASMSTDPLSSPPGQELKNLSLSSATHLHSLPTSSISALGIQQSYSVLDTGGVKSEEDYVGFDSFSHTHSSLPNHISYGTEKMMQRSFSSQSLDRKPSFFFHPRLNSFLEDPNFQTQLLGWPTNGECTGPIRRVCSTGDIQRTRLTKLSHQLSSSPLASENSFMEEGNCKVRRYSPEERKQRIHRYRSKRTQRNFNKTIKYACRKTLADSRPRVRGRFVRNDETEEIPKATGFNREEEDEDELWIDGFHEEVGTMIGVGGRGGEGGEFLNSFNPNQFQYLGF